MSAGASVPLRLTVRMKRRLRAGMAVMPSAALAVFNRIQVSASMIIGPRKVHKAVR